MSAARRQGRRSVELSNPEKVLYPRDGITKREVRDYYERMWERMRPHLHGRPLVLERFPDGIETDGFYQKQVSRGLPPWVDTVRVAKKGGGGQTLVECDRLATLAFLADQAALVLHPWLSRSDRLDAPDQLVFDLDPPGDDFAPVRRAARWCRALLDELELFSVPKLTGSRGLHVVVPLRREGSFDAVRAFARDVAERLAARHPEALTTAVRKSARGGRLYLDVARNAYAQTAVAPWSLRARPGAPCAAPIRWEDFERGRIHARSFKLRDAHRLAEGPDPWSGWRRHAASLGPARERLAALDA